MPAPIGPRLHCAIDYGFVALQALAPTLFNLKGSAKTLCFCWQSSPPQRPHRPTLRRQEANLIPEARSTGNAYPAGLTGCALRGRGAQAT
jgi:hypothetical protein